MSGWVNSGASGPNKNPNDGQSFGGFGTSGSVNGIRSMMCPGGYYLYQLRGRAGKAVDQLNEIGCRNIITGDVTTVGSQLGDSGGGVGVQLTANGTDGASGFYIRSHNEVEHIRPWWRSGVGPKTCCGSTGNTGQCGGPTPGNASYDAGDLFGPQQGANWTRNWCDDNHLVNGVSGGTAGNHILNNFGFSCRNFQHMAAIGRGPLDCCSGKDTSQDCLDVKQYLKCGDVLKTWCGTNDNIVNDATCQTAAGNKSLSEQDVDSLTLQYCKQGTNFSNPACMTLCTASTGQDNKVSLNDGSNLKDSCTALYDQKCTGSMKQTYAQTACACHQDWNTYPGVDAIAKIPGAPPSPQCYFAQCRNKGYLANPISFYGCPSCIQSQLIDINSSDNAVVSGVQQICPSASMAAAPPLPSSAPASTSVTSSARNTKSTGPLLILLFVVIVLCCCGMVGVVALF